MTKPLWPYLRLKAETPSKLKEKYRQVYLETYVRDVSNNEIKLFTWNGERVHFSPRTFDHAFSESSNYRFGDGHHDLPLSKQRARCVLWIKEVLSANQGTIQVRNQYRNDSRGKRKKRRILLVIEERYVVVLEYKEKSTDLQFVTAYIANIGSIKKNRKRRGLDRNKKKPQS